MSSSKNSLLFHFIIHSKFYHFQFALYLYYKFLIQIFFLVFQIIFLSNYLSFLLPFPFFGGGVAPDGPCFFVCLFVCLFVCFGCVGSSFLCEGFLQLQQMGVTLHRRARASHYRGLSCCGAQAPDAQARQLWLTGPVAPRHVGSSQTRARTRVPCIGRQILNHCATREAPFFFFTVLEIVDNNVFLVTTKHTQLFEVAVYYSKLAFFLKTFCLKLWLPILILSDCFPGLLRSSHPKSCFYNISLFRATGP